MRKSIIYFALVSLIAGIFTFKLYVPEISNELLVGLSGTIIGPLIRELLSDSKKDKEIKEELET